MHYASLKCLSRLATALLLMWAITSVSANAEMRMVIAGGDNGVVELKLTNISAKPATLLSWETAFEQELSGDVFAITPVGRTVEIFKRAAFTGRTFRRQAPKPSDLKIIKPSESITTSIHLADYYTIPANGPYRVKYIGNALMALSEAPRTTGKEGVISMDGFIAVSLKSNAVSMSLQKTSFPVRAQNPAFNQCTASQRNIIVTANDAAEAMTIGSRSSLQGLSLSERRSSPRYNKWFGAYTDGRFNRVLDTFQSIENALSDEVMEYDCSCDLENAYAYVYPNMPYEIYLCPIYWETSLLGAESQAGTIVHEVSHFNAVAGTNDYVYGQVLSANLAETDPDTAISNADNITFFAENDPVIPLTGEIDDPASSNISLVLDTPTAGSVERDERVLYRVAGTDLITLQTLDGDVDLLVHSDSDRSELLCESNEVERTDEVCEILTLGTVYISVVAYETSDYVLTARSALNSTNNGEVINLALNSPTTGDVEEGQYVVYKVTNAGSISVVTNSGDADLFVFTELNFTQDFLVCQSAEDFADRPIELCTVPTGQTYYAIVSGYLTSNYTIEASNANNTELEITPLIVGESIEGTLLSGQSLRYVVSNARRAVLESPAGNADLGVFSDPEYQNVVCVSQNFSDDVATDSCEFEINPAYLVVLAASDTTFRLTVDDDAGVSPETTDGSDGGSSGGSTAGSGTTGSGTTGAGTTDGAIPVDEGGSAGGSGGGACGWVSLLLVGMSRLRRKEKRFGPA